VVRSTEAKVGLHLILVETVKQWEPSMDEFDNKVRLAVYHYFVSENKAPDAREIAEAFNSDTDSIRLAFERLANEHVFVLNQKTRELLMAMPFSAVTTDYQVRIGENSWWAN
jgi:hypothetical protein